ncbi:MAG: YraN family protein [bacterium]
MNKIKNNKKDSKLKVKTKKVAIIDTNDDGKNNKKIGDLGENIATVFLEKRGFQIVDRKYRNKIGEIDIIAQKDDFYYIIEVKTLKIPSKMSIIKDEDLFNPTVSIIRDGEGAGWLKPEINLTKDKIRKVKQVALKYCADFGIREESLKFLGMCISLYHYGSRVTKTSLLSCKVKILPLFD